MALTNSPRPFRINIGCGATPTAGWLNFDNSLSVRLARWPGVMQALCAAGVVAAEQLHFARTVRRSGVRWADAARGIPLPNESAEVVYSSHMLEHLDPQHEAPRFLREVRRVLVPGGIVRIVVPDLVRRARHYVEESHDADEFVRALRMVDGTPRGVLALTRHLIAGFRNHRWMYDAASLIRLFERNGFCSARELPPGETMIPDPGLLNLREREEESVYVEARREERSGRGCQNTRAEG